MSSLVVIRSPYDKFVWFIVDAENRRYGQVMFWGPDNHMIGWTTYPEYKNRGIMSSMVPLILEQVNTDGVKAYIDNRNFASQRVAQKCCFKLTGQHNEWTQIWSLP